eukprot:4230953-Prymnesium_polylepis.1
MQLKGIRRHLTEAEEADELRGVSSSSPAAHRAHSSASASSTGISTSRRSHVEPPRLTIGA